MTSTITLYYNSLVEKEKNFILDNNKAKGIDTYLATLTSETISNFQYVKQKLNLTIKINKSQTALNMGTDAYDLNYVKIQNGSENSCYYFVDNKRWISENTIELVLQMDTLNSYLFNTDYKVSSKTFIKRQHKDRFTWMNGTKRIVIGNVIAGVPFTYNFSDVRFYYSYVNSVTITATLPGTYSWSQHLMENGLCDYIVISGGASSSGYLELLVSFEVNAFENLIDLKSEDINSPVYKTSEEMIYDSRDDINLDWALYYKTADDQETTPIDCYLVPSTDIDMSYYGVDGEIDTGDIPSGKYILFFEAYNTPAITIVVDDDEYTPYYNYDSFNKVTSLKVLAILNDSGTLKVYWGDFNDFQAGHGKWVEVSASATQIKINNPPQTIYCNQQDSLPTRSYIFSNQLYKDVYATKSISMGAETIKTYYGVPSIDKTLSTNIKIIHLPYCPTFTKLDVNGNYVFNSSWAYNQDEGLLKLVVFSVPFHNIVTSTTSSILSVFQTNIYQQININSDASRQLSDPKLLHSDYYRPKFVYDSFTKIFPLEKLSFQGCDHILPFQFDFYMTRNIVSKFLFKFNQFKYKLSNEDYDNILAVSRNNEEVLYNSQYLDYLRTGYNYDLKAKERQEINAGIGIGLNVASLVASAVIGVATENPIAIGSAVASGIGLVSQLVNYAKTTAQNEENIQRKLAETQRQAVSVLNADDYDLLLAYSENKAKMCIYEISPQMKDVLNDLFFYCGYIVNEQAVPDAYSRRSFNFVQASLVIDETNNLTEEIINNIKEKFDAGVTFLHYSFNKFDFKQDKENIEMSLFD